MNHADHVNLLRGGIPGAGGVWADFGSGAGAFTLALAELIGPTGAIYSIDKDRGALREQERAMRDRFPGLAVHYRAADFTRPIPDLSPLDGLVAANSLHFHRDKMAVVTLLKRTLRPGGRFLVVEYNVEGGNFAVPHPLSFKTWADLASRAGFTTTQLLVTRPSRFLREIYSAVSW
jgi:ubiquinone/menaquinone biosynthesis C-methylase UbiE